MDHELKQRLIGAIVVTALAAIFLPMLFDDPVENSSQQVSELTLPKPPGNLEQASEKKLPEDFGRALTPDQETPAAEPAAGEAANPTAEQTATVDNVINDDLIATETEDAPAADTDTAKAKMTEEPLDTGDVAEVEKVDDANDTPSTHKPVAGHKTLNTATEPKVKKKPKAPETEGHKIAAKPDDIEPADATHKTKPTTAKDSSGLGRWSIQAGSFSKKENAVALLEKLQKQGFPVTLQSKGDIYRLKIGPELDKQRAADMKKKLDKQNIQSLMIAE
jgi:DedD protein